MKNNYYFELLTLYKWNHREIPQEIGILWSNGYEMQHVVSLKTKSDVFQGIFTIFSIFRIKLCFTRTQSFMFWWNKETFQRWFILSNRIDVYNFGHLQRSISQLCYNNFFHVLWRSQVTNLGIFLENDFWIGRVEDMWISFRPLSLS